MDVLFLLLLKFSTLRWAGLAAVVLDDWLHIVRETHKKDLVQNFAVLTDPYQV